MTENITEAEDLSLGYLQVGSPLIAPEGPYLSWGTLRVATDVEALLATRYPAFWLNRATGAVYVREYPKRMSHLLARVVPAAVVKGEGQLRVQTFPPDRAAAVVIVDKDLHVLIPARQFMLTERPQVAYLTEEMRDQAVAFALVHGYKLAGTWEHGRDGSHRINAYPDYSRQPATS